MKANSRQLLNLRAETIDQVIQSLDRIIDWSKSNRSRLGYFAALYRKVTIRVKEGITEGEFEDGKRMERLDVIFANRYLEAFEHYQALEEPTVSWKLVFVASKKWRPIVLQHLMVGMNAHISLDLGIAAAETAAPGEIASLKNDFFTINRILASLVNEVQNELAAVWPLLKIVDRLASRFDEALANLGMNISRGRAWKIAQELNLLSPEERRARINDLDREVWESGKLILFQGYLTWVVLLFIRITEMRSVPRIIGILE